MLVHSESFKYQSSGKNGFTAQSADVGQFGETERDSKELRRWWPGQQGRTWCVQDKSPADHRGLPAALVSTCPLVANSPGPCWKGKASLPSISNNAQARRESQLKEKIRAKAG